MVRKSPGSMYKTYKMYKRCDFAGCDGLGAHGGCDLDAGDGAAVYRLGGGPLTAHDGRGQVTLACGHLIAAAIIIPAVTGRLAATRRAR